METILTQNGYSYLRLESSHYPELVKLFQKSFGVHVSLDHIAEKYATEILGAKSIGILVFDEQMDVASFYGVFPYTLSYLGSPLLAAQSGDTMTAPNHRYRGLFVTAAELVYKIAAEEGVQLIFGFPNEKSLPGFRDKLGWVFYQNMYDVKLSVPTLPLAAISKRVPMLKNTYEKIARGLLKGKLISPQDTSIQGSDAHGALQVARNDAFFQYKLRSKHNCLIQAGAFHVLIRVDGQLIVGDVNFFEADKLEAFVSTLHRLAFWLGCHRILISMSKDHWLYAYFAQSEWTPEISLPIGFKALHGEFDFSKVLFSRADYDTF